MSAPKPKVYRAVKFIERPDKPTVMSRRWTWACGCGMADVAYYGFTWQQTAMDSAIAHSRTHTAERVAEGLDRRARFAHADAIWKFEHGQHWQGVEAMGTSEGIESAALLVRKHLVMDEP